MLFDWLDRGAIPIHKSKKPQSGQVRVACVGDSITYGYGVEHWSKNNYPAVLQSLLGNGYCVNNYGFSGGTASDRGDSPYRRERVYRDSLAFRPDIVILMLGTNDSKPQNWRGAEVYANDLKKIIAAYCALPSHPEICLMAPPPVWDTDGCGVGYDIDERVLKEELYPVVQELANSENVWYIDLYHEMQEQKTLFWDGVHPNADGAKRIAEAVCQTIKKERQQA